MRIVTHINVIGELARYFSEQRLKTVIINDFLFFCMFIESFTTNTDTPLFYLIIIWGGRRRIRDVHREPEKQSAICTGVFKQEKETTEN